MATPPVIALEIGTTKVRALVGEPREDGHIMVIGLGECSSRGIRKGEVIDPENAVSCVHTALHAAEEQSDVSIVDVHLVITGGHILSMVNRGSVPVESATGEITADDMEHVMETAKAISLPTDRDVVHTVCQHYFVDDQAGVLKPEGMHGAKLALDLLIVHGVRNRIRNSSQVVRKCNMDLADTVFAPICSALAVLTPEEKERGVAVIDLGGGTTDYLVYAGGALADVGCFAVGGDHVTNDICRGLRLSLMNAEKLKEQQGSAIVNASSRSRRISVAGDTLQPERMIRVSDLNTIIHARMDEVFRLIRSQFDRQSLISQLGAGVVLVGGGSYMDGIIELAQHVLGVPCRFGKPINVSGITSATEGREYAAPLGMLRYAQRELRAGAGGGGIGGFLKKMILGRD